MYKHCTVCIAVQLSIHSLHSDSVEKHQRELFMSSLKDC